MKGNIVNILAGDIGGTKTLLHLAEKKGDQIETVAELRYDSQTYAQFEDVVDAFLADIRYDKLIHSACIGVAGPVNGKHAKVTNLPWHLNSEMLEKKYEMQQVTLLNDFQTVGYGIDVLGPDDVYTIQKGNPAKNSVRAVIGAGTGLGEGWVVWEHDRYVVHPSEGGHTDFAPVDDRQIRLLQFLRQHYARVSYEYVLSGSGLENIYWFLQCEQSGKRRDKTASAVDISNNALDKSDDLSMQAMSLFLAIYGAQAGNLALTMMATGGIYIAGGIAPRIKNLVHDSRFISEFTNKGKMQTMMSDFPVAIIDEPRVGLLGARQYAIQQLSAKLM